ncbi:Signal recognition particle GTPase [Hyphomicrobium sulfonivorans]|uniref:Signal recognition particle GTPase n=3 Tax=Hyphomicrobium sulfonivorans TaxID=121290 RepID=A0A109BDE6_HYPSL|nr:Signal recognition particle GTPase [Hyphomicrobium sulfonivorans]
MRHFYALRDNKSPFRYAAKSVPDQSKIWPDSGHTTSAKPSVTAVKPQENRVQYFKPLDRAPYRSASSTTAHGMIRFLCTLMWVSAACLFPHAASAQEGTVKAQHGDWQVVCKDPPPGAKSEVCALVQSVTAEDKDNIGLTVYFQIFSNGTRVLRVFAPLGILLPPGLGLKIDDKDVGHAPFLRCHTFACYAQVVVEDPLVEQLKNGKTAIFIIFQAEEAGIGIPISLAGFKEALAKLK